MFVLDLVIYNAFLSWRMCLHWNYNYSVGSSALLQNTLPLYKKLEKKIDILTDYVQVVSGNRRGNRLRSCRGNGRGNLLYSCLPEFPWKQSSLYTLISTLA